MMNPFLRYAFLAVILILFATNYSMSKRPQDDGKMVLAYDNKPHTETFLDTLNKGKEIVLLDGDFKPIISDTSQVIQVKSEQTQSQTEIPNGFRIQCFASSQIERIRAEQKSLETKLNYPVYIIFASPYYKLHVGDFTTREEADNALAKIKELGYSDAWVVRSKIWLKQ